MIKKIMFILIPVILLTAGFWLTKSDNLEVREVNGVNLIYKDGKLAEGTCIKTKRGKTVYKIICKDGKITEGYFYDENDLIDFEIETVKLEAGEMLKLTDYDSQAWIMGRLNLNEKQLLSYDKKAVTLPLKQMVRKGGIMIYSQFPDSKFPERKIKFMGTISDGKLDGQSYLGFDDGTVKRKTQWKNDLKHGEEIEYYPNGDILHKIEYKNGKLDGTYMNFYHGNRLEGKVTYKAGIKEGPAEFYYENGNLRAIGQFHMDKKDGEFLEYNSDGTLNYKVNYKAGNK